MATISSCNLDRFPAQAKARTIDDTMASVTTTTPASRAELPEAPTRLRFGIFLAPFHRIGENPTLALERDLELIEWLDALSFDEAWIGEHHSAGWETIAAPEIFIAAAA